MTLRLFAARHFGSRLFATFSNGHVYEHATGVTLSYELCIDQRLYPTISSAIGRMHKAMRQQMPLYRRGGVLKTASSAHVFQTLGQWLKQVPLSLSDPDANAKMRREMPSRLAIEKELAELEE